VSDIQYDRIFAVQNATRWIEAAQCELDRLRDDQDLLTRLERPAIYGRNEARPYHVLAADRHFLFVSLAHVDRALTLLGQIGAHHDGFDVRTKRQIQLVRNIYEHWDDDASSPRAWSTRAFEVEFPEDEPSHHMWSGEGAIDEIAGVRLGPLRSLLADLDVWIDKVSNSGFTVTGEAPT
jgi:hypothetical protein